MKTGATPSPSPRTLNRASNIAVIVASVEHADCKVRRGSFGATNVSASASSNGLSSLFFDDTMYSHDTLRKTHLSHEGFASSHYIDGFLSANGDLHYDLSGTTLTLLDLQALQPSLDF